MAKKAVRAPAIPFDFKEAVARLLKVKPPKRKAVKKAKAAPS
jgi:hypothetical protein